MGSGNHHATLAAVIADSIAQLRGRAEFLGKIYVETVGLENLSHDLGEIVGIVAAVVGDGNLDLAKLAETLLQVVGKALGGHAHRIAVHAVGTRSHYATEATSSKLKGLVEGVFQEFRVSVQEVSDFRLGLFVISIAEPLLGCLYYSLIHIV